MGGDFTFFLYAFWILNHVTVLPIQKINIILKIKFLPLQNSELCTKMWGGMVETTSRNKSSVFQLQYFKMPTSHKWMIYIPKNLKQVWDKGGMNKAFTVCAEFQGIQKENLPNLDNSVFVI